MFLRLFNLYRPITIVLIIIAGCALWLKLFIYPAHYNFSFQQMQMPLYRLMVQFFDKSAGGAIITSLLVSVLIGIILIRLNVMYIFIPERTYLPALFYFIISGFFAPLNTINPVIFASVFILIAIARVFQTFRSDSLCYQFFDASFSIGIASLFYFPAVAFILLLWAALILMRPFYWREWAYSILGIVLVYACMIAGYYLLDKSIKDEVAVIASYFSKSGVDTFSIFQKLMFYYVAILVVFASIFMVRIFPMAKIQARKAFQIWFAFFVISSLLYLIPGVQVEVLILLAIPLAYVFSYYFNSFKKIWIGEFMFMLLIALTVLAQYVE